MKKSLSVLIASLCLSTFSVNSEEYKWDAEIISKNYDLSIAGNANYTSPIVINGSVVSNKLNITHFDINNIYLKLQQETTTRLIPEISKIVEKASIHLRSVQATYSAPIKFKLTGKSNGGIEVKVTIPNLNIVAKAEKSWYLDVKAKLNMSNIVVSGDYNLITGVIDNPQFSATKSVDVDSNFGPFLGPLEMLTIDNIAEYIISIGVTKVITQTLLSVQNSDTKILGLDQIVQPNKYIVNNIDVGQFIKESLSGLLDKQYIEVTLYQQSLTPEPMPYRCFEPSNVTWSNNIAEVHLSGKHFLRIKRDTTQKCTWNWGSGQQPDY
ncbi:hypothetical protein RA178_03780 [Shewanella oncorhynchi]|jgi:hypothetical protein|uniref:Uncharacterized protein n=1 Tax=Shewanella oncorhynchi TaxID=2726434 RepID=A0AA50KFS2_9GAMM|nr:hypothetical protein [Shewanella oncorhynchi]WMB73757.1 hypothetical protein RA178_03780 [Shewanella oncorhynchi]